MYPDVWGLSTRCMCQSLPAATKSRNLLTCDLVAHLAGLTQAADKETKMADSWEKIGDRRHFQYIVVGCGGIGSGAIYWLSKKAAGGKIYL